MNFSFIIVSFESFFWKLNLIGLFLFHHRLEATLGLIEPEIRLLEIKTLN